MTYPTSYCPVTNFSIHGMYAHNLLYKRSSSALCYVMCIHTISNVEDGLMETGVCCSSSSMDANDHCECIVDSFVWDCPSSHVISRETLHYSSSIAAVMASPLVGVHSLWMTCIDKCHMCCILCLLGMLLESSKHTGIWLTFTRMP